MNGPVNQFKKALASGVSQIGLWLALADAYTAEICATAGFDWLLLDAEHGPNTLRSLLAQLQAIDSSASHPIVRPPVGSRDAVKQILDLGAQTLLIPMVDTEEQARAMAAAVTYPPDGERGVASGLIRASRWNRYEQYLAEARESICLIVQVESIRGLENVRAIAATAGVDGVFIGPADLAAAIGRIGQPEHPDVQEVINSAFSAIRASGKPAGIFASSQAGAERYLDMGFSFVAVGSDVGLLSQATRSAAKIHGRSVERNT